MKIIPKVNEDVKIGKDGKEYVVKEKRRGLTIRQLLDDLKEPELNDKNYIENTSTLSLTRVS